MVRKNKKDLLKVIVFLIYVVLFTIVLIASYYIWNHQESYSNLIFPEKNLWKVIEKYEETKNSWRGTIFHPDYTIRLYKIRRIDERQASEFTKVNTMKIKGLFDRVRSPYPGQISDKIICSDKFIPYEEDITTLMGIEIHYLSTYLNDRLQYGVCTEDQIENKGFVGMFYCPDVSEWYQIELIVSVKSVFNDSFYKELFLNAGCQRSLMNIGRLFP